VVKKPATKAREGVNPSPAKNDVQGQAGEQKVRALPLKSLKSM